jgi:hypothetical protein
LKFCASATIQRYFPKKTFTPFQAHGMEKHTAWRGRKFFLATQKTETPNTERLDSNKFLQVSKDLPFCKGLAKNCKCTKQITLCLSYI